MGQIYAQINDGIKKVWKVERIWELAEDLPVIEIPVDDIRGPDEVTWFNPGLPPTVRSVAEHCRRINQCDTRYPVILTEDNCVFDGMHRIAYHLLHGIKTIKVKRFDRNPEPDEVIDLNQT